MHAHERVVDMLISRGLDIGVAADGPHALGPPLNRGVRRHPGIPLSISQSVVRLSVREVRSGEVRTGTFEEVE